MLAYLRGKIKFKGANFAVVENQGLGYKVYVGLKFLNDNQIGTEVELFIHEHVREDSDDLYGFASPADLDLFEKLITVSGIGPKTAVNVFTAITAEDIRSAIINQDADRLKAPGIGAKTAERIILELKNKVSCLVGVDVKSKSQMSDESDTLEALISLGYSSYQAKEALSQVPKDVKDMSERVKQALKLLAK
jgi:holliday junction DNA helicase RuvA